MNLKNNYEFYDESVMVWNKVPVQAENAIN